MTDSRGNTIKVGDYLYSSADPRHRARVLCIGENEVQISYGVLPKKAMENSFWVRDNLT